jgi:hypothetical protein
MERRAAIRPHYRAPGLILIAVCVLMLLPAVARAADGVPLYPPGVDDAYSLTSMENPDMSGPALTFEIFGLSDPASPPVAKTPHARIMFWNAATGFNRPIGSEVPGLPPAADQRHPSVADVRSTTGTRKVCIVWQQRNDPVTATRDIWLWRGDEQGDTDAGFPMLLVSGPAGSNQYAPEIGVSKTPSGNHLIVTWADDRDTAGATTEIYALDLSANTDGDTTPDYLEPGFDLADAGDRVDPGGDLLQGQHDPVVGAKGIFWLDDRGAAGSNESDVYRASLASMAPVVTRFWHNTMGREVISPRATGEGVAWLGPGIAGGPFEPWTKKPGGSAGIITTLSSPFAFDVSGMRFAITGGHGNNTSGDEDIFFYDKATKQNVPVCSFGSDIFNELKIQTTPTISTAGGGSRVVWSDARQWTNGASTASDALAFELYVALVPTVSEAASKATLALGQSLTLSAKVTPNFTGRNVKFQKGTRHTLENSYYLGGKTVWYTNWTTLKTKALSSTSRSSWNWTPSKKGTYWVRAWFVGGKKYTDVDGRKVPHVPNTSRVIKIVVK